MTPEDLNEYNKRTLLKAELESLSPISFEEMEAVFNKWMIIPDPFMLKFLVAFYCANRLPGKAIWAFLIGPSGAGKTEFLNAFTSLEDVYSVSNLTTNTFLSGMPGANDASLLPQLSGKILMFKDWTTILSLQKDARAEIMSQLREIWDGRLRKVFGNGKDRIWEGKVSILAGTTQAVDLSQQQYTHLGERFVNYRMITPDRKTVALKALENDSNQLEMEKELKYAVFQFIKGIEFDKLDIKAHIPKNFYTEIVKLANFCTMARSGIIRDFGFKKEVVFVPDSEMPTRFAGQLAKLGAGMIIANKGKEFSIDDVKLIYKVALDSIPRTNKIVIAELARGDDRTTAQIATSLGYPTEPIKIYLENLALLKVCSRIKDGGRADKWKMNEEFVNIIREFENVIPLVDEEEKESLLMEEDDWTPPSAYLVE